MKPLLFHVTDELAGHALGATLRQWLKGRDNPASLLRGRRIQLNGNLCIDANRRLKRGDVVKVLSQPQAAPPTEADIRVHFLDAHLAIVEKPAGMTTMRYGDEVSASGRRDRMPTLLELLPRVLARELGQPVEPSSTPTVPPGRGRKAARRPRVRPPRLPRVLPVHRLDRETSGLMVFARTPAAEQALTDLFRTHDFERVYHAVVFGHPVAQRIETLIADDRGDGKRGSTNDPELGKPAVTHILPLESLGDYSLVECRLETGRTHQIRIHLSEQGHPLCGDPKYRAPTGGKPIPDRSHAPRLMLHAARLQFRHPMTQRTVAVESSWPPAFANWIRRLRKSSSNPEA